MTLEPQAQTLPERTPPSTGLLDDPPVPRSEPLVLVRDLEFAYPSLEGVPETTLCGINLTIDRGEFVAVIGSNGSGKTTLAQHLNAILIPASGQVYVDGMLTTDPQHRWAIRQRVGMVFQNPDDQLVASTLEEDVAFGPQNAGLAPAEIARRVENALSTVGLAEFRTHPPQMLSGGQKQLAAIAGALATRPSALILDEPTAMLDPAARKRLLSAITELHRSEGLTILLITQSMEEASLAQRLVVMHAGQIVLDGPPLEVFAQPEALHRMGLGLPPAVELAHGLRQRGVPLPSDIPTIQALVEALC